MIQSPSGGVYIGSSVRLTRRKIRHFSDLRHSNHHCQPLQHVWNKYSEQLRFIVLERCTSEILIEREQWWIDHVLRGGGRLYNARRTAESVGPLQESTKQKISARLKGRKKSEETRAKMRKPKTPEHVAAIVKSKTGRPTNLRWSEDERQQRRVWLTDQWANGQRAGVPAKIKASWTAERRVKHAQGFERRRILKHMEMVNWMMGG